jgi:outer membrane receptor for Fe3+-dicitrate
VTRSAVFNFLASLLLICLSCKASAADNLLILVFSDGATVPGYRVQVGDQQLITDQYGIASGDFAPGDYEVFGGSGAEQELLADIELQSSLQNRLFVNITAGQVQTHLDTPVVQSDAWSASAEGAADAGPLGPLRLRVTNAESGEPVEGARIFVRGVAAEGMSGSDGSVEMSLPYGEHDLTLVHPRFIMQVKRGVKVSAVSTEVIDVKMAPANITLDDHVVSAPFVEGSMASSIAAMRDNDVLGEGISSEQFSKSGDSSAASALKRVTGITIQDGKFVFVRGLGERYSTILLNGLHVPSPEPTKRVVPLDIFPTDIIQSMEIQKTYASDLPGTFGGGTVLITTRDIPEEDNYVQLTVSAGVNDATGEKQLFNGDNDKSVPPLLLKLSDDFSPLTEEVVLGGTVLAEGITAEEKEALNLAMVNYRQYALKERVAGPEGGISATAGQGFRTSGGLRYGLAANVYYDIEDDASDIDTEEYQFEDGSDQVVHVESSSQSVTRLAEKSGGMLSFAIEDVDRYKLKYTLALLNEAEDLTNFAEVNQRVEGRLRERTFLQYVERSLQVHQLNGVHQLPMDAIGLDNGVELSWGVGLSTATRLEPGSFEYEYKEASGEFVVDQKKLFYLYSDLEDNVDNYRVDLRVPFTLWGRDQETRVGYFLLEKDRTLDNRRFKIDYEDTLDNRGIDEVISEQSVDDGILDVLDSYKPDDFYTATQSENAFYINQILRPFEPLQIGVGARAETSTQELRVGEEQTRSSLETDDVLPYLSMTYAVSRNSQIRLGYSQTLSRPDFREFSPNRYKDPITEEIVFGFEGLQATEITNYDLRFEVFPNFEEFYSIGVFAKDFINPIETVRTISDVDVEISFRNAPSAQSVGLEAGFRKSLSNIGSFLNNFYLSGNYAYIESEIELDKDNPEFANDQFIPFLTSDKRPMQGQSPYVVNASFGYDNFHTRRSAAFLYNVYGKRITSLGINGNPDIYAEPFHQLDFVAKWGLNDSYDEQRKKIAYTLGFKVQNILGSTREETQGGLLVRSYDPGRSYGISFSMKY